MELRQCSPPPGGSTLIPLAAPVVTNSLRRSTSIRFQFSVVSLQSRALRAIQEQIRLAVDSVFSCALVAH
jgi:hypothetical protein